jgi:hypothetical protein
LHYLTCLVKVYKLKKKEVHFQAGTRTMKVGL